MSKCNWHSCCITDGSYAITYLTLTSMKLFEFACFRAVNYNAMSNNVTINALTFDSGLLHLVQHNGGWALWLYNSTILHNHVCHVSKK